MTKEIRQIFYISRGYLSKSERNITTEVRTRCLAFTHFIQYATRTHPTIFNNGCPRGVMVKAMNCGIVVREFVLQSRYYVHFRANTLGKGMNPLILPPAMDK